MAALEGLLPAGFGVLPAFFLVIASLFTSATTAAFGVGGGLALLALMGLVMPVSALIPVHGAVQLVSNSGRAWHMRAHASASVLLPFFIGAVFGAVIGGSLVIELPDAALKTVLGVFVIVAVWARMPAAGAGSPVLLAAGGVLTTALTMFVGATGPLVNAMFARVFEARQALVASAAVAMAAQHGLKIVVFGLFGFAFAPWLPLIVAMILSGYLGTMIGARLLGAMSEGLFRTVFKVALTLLALDMIRRGLLG